MKDNIIKQLMTIVDKKFWLNEENSSDPKYEWLAQWIKSESYIQAMQDEIKEVEEELKPDNKVYLEDELGDLLWDYLNLLHCLEKESKIDLESVFTRAIKKYSERTDALEAGITWDEIKKNQKQELLKEHNEKYNA